MLNETQVRRKYTEAMIKKLPKKNQKYYVLDSEVIGLRVYVQITGEKSFYLQRYLKEFKYSKKSKIGDFPEMSISAARKLAALIKADNVQGKDPIIAAAERAKEKTLGDVCEEYLAKKHDPKIKDHQKRKAEKGSMEAWLMGSSNDPKIIAVWRKYRDTLNINSKQLSKINAEHVLEYHGAASTKTTYVANRMVGVINKLFNYAKVKGYYSGDNPASKLKKKLNEEISDHLDYYSSEDMNKLIAAALKKSKKHDKRAGCYAILASLFCGGRPQSEVFNLTVDQIDIKNKCIHYKKSKVGQWTRPITPRMIEHLELITKQGYKYTGIDISKSLVNYAKEKNKKFIKNKKASFYAGSMDKKLKFKNEQFDAVIIIGALQYVMNINGCIKEIKRVLKKDGKLILAQSNSFAIMDIIYPRKFIRFLVRVFFKEEFTYSYSTTLKSTIIENTRLKKLLGVNGNERWLNFKLFTSGEYNPWNFKGKRRILSYDRIKKILKSYNFESITYSFGGVFFYRDIKNLNVIFYILNILLNGLSKIKIFDFILDRIGSSNIFVFRKF